MIKHVTPMDTLIQNIDIALRTLCIPANRKTMRKSPAQMICNESLLTLKEKKHVARLLRVNHAGEVCAQALYQGQALSAELQTVKTQMEQAAFEEVDHLGWCEERLLELNSSPSLLNPLWYIGSLSLGILAGTLGHTWSLGFVVETERQVTAHLSRHLQNIPTHDFKTRAILSQMHADETHHAESALDAGGKPLPKVIKVLMAWTSKVLTTASQYI